MRLSHKQIQALRAVEAGRVEWGSEYPSRDRRLGRCDFPVFLVDGYGVYGGEHRTFESLSVRELITERVDLLPTKTLPAETRHNTGIATNKALHIPERKVPADDGWRARVELTASGRAALDHTNQRPA